MTDKPGVPICPACGGRDYVQLLRSPDFRYGSDREFAVRRCRTCDLIATHPRLSWEELTEYYPDEYYSQRPTEAHSFSSHPGRSNWPLTSLIEQKTLIDDLEPGRLLEIGCGTGDVLAYWKSNGWDCKGIEPSGEAARIARERYGLDVMNKRFENCTLQENHYDVILLDNVLEHLPEPFEVIHRCKDLLTPGGALVIEVPNVDSIGFRIFGRYWSDLDVPRHLYHFSPSVLRRETEKRGFRFDDITYTGHPISLRYSLNRWLRTKGHDDLGSWASFPLLPISILAGMIGGGDKFRIRFCTSSM